MKQKASFKVKENFYNDFLSAKKKVKDLKPNIHLKIDTRTNFHNL